MVVVKLVKNDMLQLSNTGSAKKDIGYRILFGTDYFMTVQEKDERSLYVDFRKELNDPQLWENLIYHNNKEFLSSVFYSMP